jgi:hypothetical protein
MMLPLLAHLRVQRTIGRPRTRPDRVLPDKAYSSRAIRAHLGTRGIGSVIPEPDDQKAHRKRIGSSGGRPVTDDRTAYRGRNVIERLQRLQTLAPAGHQIRQARHGLPRRPRPRSRAALAHLLRRHVLVQRLEQQADVEGRRRVGQSPDTDEIDTRLGHGSYVVERDTAGGLELRASAHQRDRSA